MAKKLVRSVVGFLSILVLVASSLTVFVPAQKAEARDCDANAIIYCGVGSLDELKTKYAQNQGGNLHAIFSHFGIPNAEYMDDMVMGRVTRSGDVYVGEERVAHGAVTAGRQNMPGSTKIPGVEAYKRSPSVSFRSDSLPSLVKMVDGRFHTAVIMSCGNPVNAHPIENPKPAPQPQPKPKPQPKPEPKNPDLSILKYVRISGDDTWRSRITADPGENVDYRIVVENTGDVELTDVEIQDSLPTGVSFEDAELEGSTELEGNMVSDLVGEGIELDALAENGHIEIIYTVTVGEEADACETPMRNVAYAKAKDVPEKDDEAFVEVCQPEEPEPVVKAVATQPESLPATGAMGVFGIFSATSVLGFGTYKLKELFAKLLR